ncbi:MAG: hypothetical protein IKI29_03075 [Clostridia bacterium]|nr:hypothetical protein [Clostridia bacterium]
MFEGFLLICWALLALFGLSELLYELWAIMTVSKKSRKKDVIFLLEDETAEEQLRFIRLQRRWWGNNFAQRIFVVADGLSDAYAAACRRFCENNQLIFCNAKDLPALATEDMKESREEHRLASNGGTASGTVDREGDGG